MNEKSITRRNFIRVTATGISSVSILGCYNLSRSAYVALTLQEAAIIDALADQIIPPDEFAGGKEAGVTRFIDKQLDGFYSGFKPMYKTCIAALNTLSVDLYGKEFIELEFESQFQYLTDIESGKYNDKDWGEYSGSGFFGTFRSHCMQGYYGSPRHGGNRNYVSYKMLKLDYPLIIGRNVH
jgi:gluconate 2-dehydrogenase gamma chain